ncbi:MAG: cyclase family protein [Novosphingobium sp.]|nr:cyclase family protein [Novosphingobium sp.]
MREEGVATEALQAFDVVRSMGRDVRNWGRWGDLDTRGTLNLIDAEATLRAAAAIRSGEGFALGLELSRDGPQCGLPPERFNPHHYLSAIGKGAPGFPGFRFSDDVIMLPNQCATQCDGLAHVHYDELLYNGYKASQTLSIDGAKPLGIESLASKPLATRGILLDFPRLWGTERLPTGTIIDAEALNAAVRETKLEVRSGDAILIRTGHINVFLEDGDREAYNFGAPGLTVNAVPWLRERDIAFVGSDTTLVEVFPAENPLLMCPVHLLLIRDMGMPLGEMYNLEALARACTLDRRWDFFFSAQPLAISGGIGSPTNPIVLR